MCLLDQKEIDVLQWPQQRLKEGVIKEQVSTEQSECDTSASAPTMFRDMSGCICVIFLNNLGSSLLREFVLKSASPLICLVHCVNNLHERKKSLKK